MPTKKTLAEQILALSDPQPASFHPDEELLADETAAKVCDFSYEREGGEEARVGVGVRRKKRLGPVEEDPRYAGKVVSRKDLEFNQSPSPGEDSNSSAEESDELTENQFEQESGEDDFASEDDEESDGEVENESADDVTTSDQSEAGEEEAGEEEEGEGGGVTALPVKSLVENAEKGEMARKQMKLLDGLLESRIKFQGILSLANRLPAPGNLPLFLKEGGDTLQETLDETCQNLQHLLDSLLDLQTTLHQPSSASRDEDEDEDIDSDSEEVGGANDEQSTPPGGSRSTRKRKRPEGSKGRGSTLGDYEAEITERHKKLRSHCDDVISRWSEKMKLASGKVTSKAFMNVERSTLSQIEHVLKDKERLRKRTQLKRSVYRILGEEEEGEEPERKTDRSEHERDSHLKDYNEHIFDDDDFYHQLLRELIERKTSYTESSDPIEMGRQWLELQKLRRKAKKVVDTKASKGRKIRYNVHPKLVNFMAPVESSRSFSDTAKNNLFSSLFGARQNYNSI